MVAKTSRCAIININPIRFYRSLGDRGRGHGVAIASCHSLAVNSIHLLCCKNVPLGLPYAVPCARKTNKRMNGLLPPPPGIRYGSHPRHATKQCADLLNATAHPAHQAPSYLSPSGPVSFFSWPPRTTKKNGPPPLLISTPLGTANSTHRSTRCR